MKSIIFQGSRGGPIFSRGGSNFFQGGGGGGIAYSLIEIKSNQINFIGIKSSHRTVTSHIYTVTQEQSQT